MTTNFRAIFFIIGVFLLVLSGAMIIPLMAEMLFYKGTVDAFVISMGITLFLGGTLTLTTYSKDQQDFGPREIFLLTTLTWIFMCLFASIPFVLSATDLSVIDALFEGVSALTTTGSTVIPSIQSLEKGLQLWRSLLQWMGGIGIIVMAIIVLPGLKIGGMQLFRSEFSDRSEKILPKISQVATAIVSTYTLLTVLCGILLILAGMTLHDAACHALSTISTGGLSTKDSSIAAYNNPAIEVILMLFMLIGGSTLILWIKAVRGDWKSLAYDQQTRAYLWLVGIAAGSVSLWLWLKLGHSITHALRLGFFNTISVITSTGFSTADYQTWGPFPQLVIFLISMTGGCTGSTTGGIKVFRIFVLIKSAHIQLRNLFQPNRVLLLLYNNQPLSGSVLQAVSGFVVLYSATLFLLALGLSATGLDFISALTGAASSLGNIGFGMGHLIGPSGNFAPLPDLAKSILMAGMILGRLELLTVLVIFLPSFWRD